ncbi:family with sequence similarity 171 member B [Heptranchias perlo]|uniref:family with sequence similarity 171 member B n=1 Tax=Heptranchias perlo TaxID=212740 RepID=UPI00355AB3CA
MLEMFSYLVLFGLIFCNVLNASVRSKLTVKAGVEVHNKTGKLQTNQPRLLESLQLPGKSPGSLFTLKVQINDVVTRHYLDQAIVDVFVNYTKTNSALTEDGGGVIFKVPYKLGLTLTVTARKGGYLLASLPWKTRRVPVFAAVTLSMLPQSRANLWLFEDTILITGGKIDDQRYPSVQFPKGLLRLSKNTHVSNLTAYLTAPQPPWGTDNFIHTMGILMNKSRLKSIELTPLAAISVQLFSGEDDVKVAGSIHITLPLGPTDLVTHADALPAWTFDQKIGAWVNRGLGTVRKEDDHLVWTYIAPHLGHWIAAPLPLTKGTIGRIAKDITTYHTMLLVAILGGTTVILVGFVAVLFCYCRGRYSHPLKKPRNKIKMDTSKKDQTTSTSHVNLPPATKENLKPDEKPASQQPKVVSYSPRRELSQKEVDEFCKLVSKTAEKQNNESCKIYVENFTVRSRKKFGDNLHHRETVSQQAVNSPEDVPKNALQIKHMKMLARRKEMIEEQYKMQHTVNEEMYQLPHISNKLLPVYNPTMAVMQTQDLFCTPDQVARSATLPRNRQIIYSPLAETLTRDNYTQTLSKMPLHSQQQTESHRQQQILQGQQDYINAKQVMDSKSVLPANWGRYSNNLLESVSVPGTLNEAVGMTPFATELQGISEQTLLEMTKGKPSPHPRAWFVSLEGKPVPPIRHSCMVVQKPKKAHSNDTSLDSGVDMNEHHTGKKLEKEKTFIKSTPASKSLYSEDMDLSGSESGTTVCTPEDLSFRHMLDIGSDQIIEVEEEQSDRDLQEDELSLTPPNRKGRLSTDGDGEDSKKSVWQKREERPLISIN